MNTPVRIGLIGCGHAAELQRRAFAVLDDFELACVCDIDDQRARDHGNVASYSLLDDFIAEARFDVASICVPPSAHLAVAGRAAEAGKPLLIEKPATPSGDEFAALKDVVAGTATLAYVCQHAAFGREVVWAAAEIAQLRGNGRELGAVTAFRCSFNDPYCNPSGAVRPEATSLGGSWLDSGINALSVVARITPLDQWALLDARFEGTAVDVDAQIRFKGSRGAVGAVSTSWTNGIDRKSSEFEFQSGARLKLDHSAQSGRLSFPGGTRRLSARSAHRERLLEHYVSMLTDFRNSIARGRGNLDAVEPSHRLLHEAARRRA